MKLSKKNLIAFLHALSSFIFCFVQSAEDEEKEMFNRGQSPGQQSIDVVVNGGLVRFASSNFGDYISTADRPAEFYPVTEYWDAIPATNES